MSEPSVSPARILHVDDDPDVLRQAREYIQGEEIEGWGRPSVIGMTEFADALSALEATRFDLIILDVRLGGHEQRDIAQGEEAGVRTLEAIRARRFVPITFWTGLPATVRDLEGPLVRVVGKTEGLDTLLATAKQLFATKLPLVNRALIRLLEDEQRSYMWDFVAERWDELQRAGDHTALAYLLARRMGRSLSGAGIQKLAEELGETERGFPTGELVHPIETYVMPPMRGPALVGDLFNGSLNEGDPEAWWLLLTPSCDLQQNKAEQVVLAECRRLEEEEEMLAWRARGSNRTRQAVERILRRAGGGQDDRRLYLPAALDVPDLVADLQRLASVSCDRLADMSRVASLDSPFAEATVSRFTRYFGRVGTPDLDTDLIFRRLEEAPGAGPGPGDREPLDGLGENSRE